MDNRENPYASGDGDAVSLKQTVSHNNRTRRYSGLIWLAATIIVLLILPAVPRKPHIDIALGAVLLCGLIWFACNINDRINRIAGVLSMVICIVAVTAIVISYFPMH